MIRIDAQVRMPTVWALLKTLPVGGFERDRLEEDHHDEIQSPHFISLSQTVDSPHLPLLVGVRENAKLPPLLRARNAENKVFSAILRSEIVFASGNDFAQRRIFRNCFLCNEQHWQVHRCVKVYMYVCIIRFHLPG